MENWDDVVGVGGPTSQKISFVEVNQRWPEAIASLSQVWEEKGGQPPTIADIKNGDFYLENPGVCNATLDLNLRNPDDWQLVPGKILAYCDDEVTWVYTGGDWESID